MVAGTNTVFGLAERTAEFLAGTSVVCDFSILVHSQPSLTDRIACQKSFVLSLALFERYKGFTSIDRFHGVVDDFRIVALIRKKGTSLQRDDLVGCGEDVNGNCGIHDVGWCGQLI